MVNRLTGCGGVSFDLLHDGPGGGGVGAVQDFSHQHGFEEGPGDGSPCGVDHVQVHVHAERGCGRQETSRSAAAEAQEPLETSQLHTHRQSSES